MGIDFVSLLVDNPETKDLGRDVQGLLTEESTLSVTEVQDRVVDIQRRIAAIENPPFNRSLAVYAIGQIAVNHKSSADSQPQH